MSQLLHFSAEIEIARRIRRAIAILSPRSASKPHCVSADAEIAQRTIRFSPELTVPSVEEANVCLDPQRCGFHRCRGVCRDLPPAA